MRPGQLLKWTKSSVDSYPGLDRELEVMAIWALTFMVFIFIAAAALTAHLWLRSAKTKRLAELGCFLWWGIESLLYYSKMRRRAQIGLAEPIECERFRLLGYGSVLVAGALALVPFSGWVLGCLPREMPAVLAAIILLAAGGAAALISGLFAPHFFYRSPAEDEPRR